MKQKHWRIVFCWILLVPALPDLARTAENQNKPRPIVEAPANPNAVRYESGIRRDPFLNPFVHKKKAENPDEEMPRGQPPPGIAGMLIAQVKLLGIVQGEGAPTAAFQGIDKRAYFLQEKDKLFDGYIKKIDADTVILIRETKLRSGKLISQEVIKRLRTP